MFAVSKSFYNYALVVMSSMCVVCGKKKRTHDISLFRFPYNDPPRFVQWLVRLKLTAEEVKSTDRVCSDHFLPDSYETLQVKCPELQPSACQSVPKVTRTLKPSHRLRKSKTNQLERKGNGALLEKRKKLDRFELTRLPLLLGSLYRKNTDFVSF